MKAVVAAVLQMMPTTAAIVAAARESVELLIGACELTGTAVEVAEWMVTVTPWSRDEVRRRILLGEGARWTERYRCQR